MKGSRLRTTAVLALAVHGCVVTGDAGALTTAATDGATDGSASTSGDTGIADATTADAEKLDLALPDLETSECESVTQTTEIEESPSDIVIVVANVLNQTQIDSIFQNFSLLIGNDLIEDVQVAMLAGYPPGGVCIEEPPLGVQACPTTDDNPPMYRHIDESIEPDTLLQQLLDAYPLWSASLRPEARKHVFVVSSGDSTLDTDAFATAFVALDPTLAGYVFHAMAPGPDPGDCSFVEPGAPWATASDYAAHVASTGGVFENACDFNVGFLFEQLLDRIVATSLSCAYDIPDPPAGLVFEQGKVNVDYDDGFGDQTIGWVESLDDCADVGNGWYYDDLADPQQILMCPQTCGRFQSLSNASIEIRFGCTTIPAG